LFESAVIRQLPRGNIKIYPVELCVKKLWHCIRRTGSKKPAVFYGLIGLILVVSAMSVEGTAPPAGSTIVSQSYAEYYDGPWFLQSFSPQVLTQVAPLWAISLLPSGTVDNPAYTLTGNCSDTLYCTFTLENLGNTRDSVAVNFQLIPPSTAGIDQLIFFYDTNANARFDPGEENPTFLALDIGESVEMTTAIILPVEADGSDSYIRIAAHSTGDSLPTVETSVVRVRNLTGLLLSLFLGPQGNPRALPGGEGSSDDVTVRSVNRGIRYIDFQNDLLNGADVADVVEIGLADSTQIPDGITVSLVDTLGQSRGLTPNAENMLLLGPLGAGETRSVLVRVAGNSGPLLSLIEDGLPIEMIVRSRMDSLRSNRTINRLVPAQDDGASAMITLEQTFKENTAATGDIATFVVTVRNISDSLDVSNVTVTEISQPALNFLRSDGFERAGETLVWHVGDLASGQERKSVIKFLVNSRVFRGWTKVMGESRGLGENGDAVSAGPAVSALRIENDLFASEGMILGEVFIDENNNTLRDEGEEGVPAAAVYLESGVFAVTDSLGKFSIPEAFAGYRVVRLDESTLPPDVVVADPLSGRLANDTNEGSTPGKSTSERLVHLLPGGHASIRFPVRRRAEPPMEELMLPRHISCQEKVSMQKRHRIIFKMLSIPSSQFPSGKAFLRTNTLDVIKPVTVFLLTNPGWKVLIEGHTDNIPIRNPKNFRNNEELSRARAEAVKRYLEANSVSSYSIIVRGYGDRRPIADNSTKEGRNLNRRVELSFVPPGVNYENEAALQRVQTEWQSIGALPDSFQVKIFWEFITNSSETRDAAFTTRIPSCLTNVNVTVECNGQKIEPHQDVYHLSGFKKASSVRCEVDFFVAESDTAKIREAAALFKFKPNRSAQQATNDHTVDQKYTRPDSIVVHPFAGGRSLDSTTAFDLASWHEKAMNMPEEVEPAADVRIDSVSAGQNDGNSKAIGILLPENGRVYTRKNRVTVRARVPLGSRYTLFAGGLAVSDKLIGQKDIHIEQKHEDITWFGVEIMSGMSVICVRGRGIDGTVFEDSIQVLLSSQPRKLSAERSRLMIPADGQARETVRFAIEDGLGCPVADGYVATITRGDTLLVNADERPLQRGLQVLSRDGYFVVHTKPGRRTGRNTIVIECEELRASCDVAFVPPERPLFVAGILEAKLGIFDASGSADPLGLTDYYDGVQFKGASRMFLQGTGYGGMNLTARLDTRKRYKDPFSPTLEPDQNYAIYGDASELHYAAPSQGGNYIAVEKDESYVRYGDFRTPLNNGEFLRYERAATGVNTAFTSGDHNFKAFLTKSDFGTVKDELQGDGTSGYYYFSRSPVVEHSEKIVLEIRDRYQREKILEVRPLARNRDYTLSYFDGAVLFKSPVPVTDDAFNPVYIVAIYEVRLEGEARYLYGLRGELARNRYARIGASTVSRGGDGQRYTLYGMDGGITYGGLGMAGEFARSEDDVSGNGNAFKVEASFRNKITENSVYLRRVDGTFLNPSFSGGAHELATLKMGYESLLRIADGISLHSDGFKHQLEKTGEEKESARAFMKLNGQSYQMKAGVRGARHEREDQRDKGLLAIAGVGAGSEGGAKFSVGMEKNLQSQSVEDYPDRLKSLLGLPFLDRYRFLANHEYRTASGKTGTHQAVTGVESKVGEGGTAYTKYSMNRTAGDERMGAVTGLKHKIDLSKKIAGTFDVEGFRSLSENPETDYFALKTGLSKLERGAHLLEGQYEYRWQMDRQKHLLRFSALTEMQNDVSVLLKNTFSFSEIVDRKDAMSLKGRLACAYRPEVSPIKALCFLKTGYERFTPIDPDAITWKMILSTDVNVIPAAAHEVRLKYAIKRVEDYSLGISLTSWSQLMLSQYVYYFSELWDVDLWGRVLTQATGGTMELGTGVEVGRRFFNTVRVSAGYSINGFEERDLSENAAWAKGFGLRVQFILSDWLLREMGL
jgi:outer membrane protein OmpA-like peptidoglycan-associated protein